MKFTWFSDSILNYIYIHFGNTVCHWCKFMNTIQFRRNWNYLTHLKLWVLWVSTCLLARPQHRLFRSGGCQTAQKKAKITGSGKLDSNLSSSDDKDSDWLNEQCWRCKRRVLIKLIHKMSLGTKLFFLIYCYLSMINSQIKYLNRKKSSLVLLVPQEPRLASRYQFPVSGSHGWSVENSLLEI